MSNIKVCDAIMGSGKTEAAITYMNEHPGERFIYVSPYLDEGKRVVASCKNIRLHEPQQWKQYNGSKLEHTLMMLQQGRSIASTHQALRRYADEMLDIIREKQYTLIIDENLEALQETSCTDCDFRLLLGGGYLEADPLEKDHYHVTDMAEKYNGVHANFFREIGDRDIIAVPKNDTVYTYYWMFPPEVLEAFNSVYILTYKFEGQGLSYCLSINGIPYQKIGVSRDGNGVYRFDKNGTYVPDYVHSLRDMIHIANFGHCNAIGEKLTALSSNWFKRASVNEIETLRKNTYTFFRTHTDTSSDERMWSTFKDDVRQLRGGGYTKGFVTFNARASNNYRHKTALAYCVNVYMPADQKAFFRDKGAVIQEDDYALSTMVQWIWRSAIRDGHPINLYLPSSRMRKILCSWINDFE